MKTSLLLLLILVSTSIQAACKCNCDPTDRSICASLYDIDRPCGSICSSPNPGFTPMITANPVRQAVNPLTGAKEWLVDPLN